MSRALLLRHSKAARATPGMHDFDRPLEEQGRRHAAAVGEAMAAAGLVPDLVLCSPSRRTRETWDGVKSKVGEIETRFLDELYHSDAGGYLEAIRQAGEVNSVLIVGHNPMTAEAATLLAGSGSRRDLASMRTRYPTSSLAVIAFETPLSGIAPGAGALETWMTRD